MLEKLAVIADIGMVEVLPFSLWNIPQKDMKWTKQAVRSEFPIFVWTTSILPVTLGCPLLTEPDGNGCEKQLSSGAKPSPESASSSSTLCPEDRSRATSLRKHPRDFE